LSSLPPRLSLLIHPRRQIACVHPLRLILSKNLSSLQEQKDITQCLSRRTKTQLQLQLPIRTNYPLQTHISHVLHTHIITTGLDNRHHVRVYVTLLHHLLYPKSNPIQVKVSLDPYRPLRLLPLVQVYPNPLVSSIHTLIEREHCRIGYKEVGASSQQVVDRTDLCITIATDTCLIKLLQVVILGYLSTRLDKSSLKHKLRKTSALLDLPGSLRRRIERRPR